MLEQLQINDNDNKKQHKEMQISQLYGNTEEGKLLTTYSVLILKRHLSELKGYEGQ